MALMQGKKQKLGSSNGDKLIALFLIWHLRKKAAYGYQLIGEVEQLGLSARCQSALYLILSNLEKAGLIKSRSKQAGRRVRRMYKTTAKGAALFEKVKSTRIKGLLRDFISELLS